MKKIFTIICLILSVAGMAQVKIGTPGAPHPRAILDLSGDTARGLLMPRLTAGQRAALTNVPQGLMIFQTDGVSGLYYNRSASPGITNWAYAAEGNNYWAPAGFSDQNHIYTTASGNTGIGTSAFAAPLMKLHVEDADSNIAVFSNTASLAANTKAGIYLKTGNLFAGNYYTGAVKSIGISATDARLGLFTGAAGSPNTLSEKLTVLSNGNVGIGTTAPNSMLEIKTPTGDATAEISGSNGILRLNKNTASAGTAIRFKSAGTVNWDLGSIGDNDFNLEHTPTGTTVFTADDVTQNVGFLKNVGIGNLNPLLAGLIVDSKVGAVNAMFGDNTTGVAIESNYPGVGFNTYFNNGRKAINTGFGSLVGQDPATGRFYIQTAAASVTGQGTAINTFDRLNILPNGNIGVQGNTNPQSPLSFSNALGDKINFYTVGANASYGIGIQGAHMQLYTGSSTDAISLGYGNSSNFTAKTTFQNGYMVLNNGRIRFNGQYSSGNSSGIEFTGIAANSALRGFIGQYDDNNMGMFGYGGSGWGFLYDVNDGAVKIGTTQKATGYMLNVGGKIIAEEVRVQLRSAWPDYVFNKNYNLRPLKEVATYISNNNHLPNVPAAADIEKSGIALGEMQTKMMEKIEELTLYVIELEKKVEKLSRKQ